MPYYIQSNPDNDYHRLVGDSNIDLTDGRRVEILVRLDDTGPTERRLTGASGNDYIVFTNTGSSRLYIDGNLTFGSSVSDIYTKPVIISIERDGTDNILKANGNTIATDTDNRDFSIRNIFESSGGQGSCSGDFYWMRVYDNDVLVGEYLPDSADGTTMNDSFNTFPDFELSNYQADPYILYYSIESIDKTTFKPSEDVTFSVTSGYTPTSASLSDGTKTLTGIELVSTGTANQYRINIPMGNAAGFPEFGNVTLTLSDGTTTVDQVLTFNKPDNLTEVTLSGAVIKDETSVSFTFPAHPQLGDKYYYDATMITISNNNVLSIVAGATFETTVYLMDGQGLQEFTIADSQPQVSLPVANAGPNQTVDEGTEVTLDASGSTGATSYSWTQIGTPAVTLTGSNTANPTFTAPDVTDDITLTFQVTATNDDGSDTDTVIISVEDVPEVITNEPPRFTVPRYFTEIGHDSQSSNSYVNLSESILLDGDFSIEAVVYPTDDTNESFILGSDVDNDFWFAVQYGVDRIRCVINDNFGFNWDGITSNVLINRFNHLKLVRTGSDAELFINGVSQGVRSGNSESGRVSLIGRRALDRSNYFYGIISQVKIEDKGVPMLDMKIDKDYTPKKNIVANDDVKLGKNLVEAFDGTYTTSSGIQYSKDVNKFTLSASIVDRYPTLTLLDVIDGDKHYLLRAKANNTSSNEIRVRTKEPTSDQIRLLPGQSIDETVLITQGTRLELVIESETPVVNEEVEVEIFLQEILPVSGANLISTDTGDWNLTNATVEFIDGKVRVTNTSDAQGIAQLTIPQSEAPVGGRYRLDVSGSDFSNGAGEIWLTSPFTPAGVNGVYELTTDNTLTINIRSNNPVTGAYVEYDIPELRRIYGEDQGTYGTFVNVTEGDSTRYTFDETLDTYGAFLGPSRVLGTPRLIQEYWTDNGDNTYTYNSTTGDFRALQIAEHAVVGDDYYVKFTTDATTGIDKLATHGTTTRIQALISGGTVSGIRTASSTTFPNFARNGGDPAGFTQTLSDVDVRRALVLGTEALVTSPPDTPSNLKIYRSEGYSLHLRAGISIKDFIRALDTRLRAIEGNSDPVDDLKLYRDEGFGVHFKTALEWAEIVTDIEQRINALDSNSGTTEIPMYRAEGYGIHFRSAVLLAELLDDLEARIDNL